MYICGVVHLIFKNIAVENNFSGAIDKMRGVCCATYDSSFGWRKFAAFDINIFDIFILHFLLISLLYAEVG